MSVKQTEYCFLFKQENSFDLLHLRIIDTELRLHCRFRMAVLMGTRWFPYVESSSKKEGKKEAADVALRVLMAEGSYQMNDTPSSVCVLCTYCIVCLIGVIFVSGAQKLTFNHAVN